MSRLLFRAFGLLLSLLATATTFAVTVSARLTEVWPIAFPTPPTLARPRVTVVSREDAHPVARRFREYLVRVLDRMTTTPSPGLIAA